ncbi:MAG: hypothetical protein Kow0056_13610 [Coriobacteriia bacterium]
MTARAASRRRSSGRSRRDTELLLLLAAAAPVMLVFALAQVASERALVLSDLAVPAGLLLAFLVAHVATRIKAPDGDPALLPLAALLTGIGVTFVSRLDAEQGTSQTAWVLLGVLAYVLTLFAVPSLERLARYKYTVMLAGIALLLLPAFVGVEVNGARLWLRVAGFSFQPAEVAKILIVIFLAAYLAERRELLSVSKRRFLGIRLPRARHLGPLIFMWAVSLVILVMEKDLGSSLLFFGVFLVMIVVATGRPAYAIAGTALFSAGAYFAWRVFSHVQDRIAIWLDPFADAQGAGYQLVQSLFALAAGGMTGVGIARGLPERIPFVETDFIFSAIGEELGFLGGAALILAYLVLCVRGLATAARARSDMASLTATGLVATLGLQAFVIVGGVTRLIPLTGITLPFVSYGGSSILSNFILLALLVRAGDAPRTAAALAQDAPGKLGRRALIRRLVGVATLISVLVAALLVNLTYVQVVAASDLNSHEANTRGLAEELSLERGSILTADGVVLAESVPAGGRYRREYPEGDLAAHVVGYYSPRYGRAGIEAAMNETLVGRRDYTDLSDLLDSAIGREEPGNDVVLTIDSRVQRAAQQALAGVKGAIVAIDPSTGAILAMASSPSYEPAGVDEDFTSLSSDPDAAPLLNRATASLYPPGSTFKVVTLTAALSGGVVTPDTTYSGRSPIEIGGGRVTNYGGASYGQTTVRDATRRSINTVFAQIAVDTGAKRLVEQARGFGFGEEPPVEIPALASQMPDPDVMSTWELAWAGVGQPVGMHEGPIGPSVTPLQMALVAAGIANDGVVMEPHLVERVTDYAGRTLDESQPREWKTAVDKRTADEVENIMALVVSSGTGTRARLPNIPVAGKTGTAEVGEDVPTHAWFICFAPVDAPRVAVAVIVEGGGTGGVAAAPRAKQVLEAALGVDG